MINVMYGGNEGVYQGILLSVMSMIKFNKMPMHVYILTMDMQEKNPSYKAITFKEALYLEDVMKRVCPDSLVSLLDVKKEFLEAFSKSPNLDSFYTPYCLLRLLADKLNLPEKILYLDSDVLFVNNVNMLYSWSIVGYEYGAVVDVMGKIFKNPHYINSGVLLLNLDEIKKTGLFQKTRQAIENKRSQFPDQDALNKYTTKRIFLPRCFNEQRGIKKDTVIKHFCRGIKFLPIFKVYNVKPWEIERVQSVLKIDFFDDLFMDYKKVKREIEWSESHA